MSQSVVILGRQPALGLAELESLFGADRLQPAGPLAAVLDAEPEQVPFGRLGGAMKLARLLTRLETTDWDKVEIHLRKNLARYLQDTPDGKVKLGLSVHGFNISVSRLNASGLTLKKIVKAAGRSVRVVPNKELELNSAQVQHNSLTSPTGWEILAIRDGDSTILARTIAVQDIDAYAARDQGRPKRDARVGMLPPKLAQTIVNLAAAETAPTDGLVIDPFCGTGVVLQEALLMGYDVYGSDIEPRMTDFTAKNLEWLEEKYRPEGTVRQLDTGDATDHLWQLSPDDNAIIACEGYLGQPFSVFPPAEKLAEIRTTCNLILKKFLRNAAGQLKPGSRLCLAVPAWQQRPGVYTRLPLLGNASGTGLDHLEEMGYNRLSFKHVKQEDLVYARADQIVARELLVLIKQ